MMYSIESRQLFDWSEFRDSFIRESMKLYFALSQNIFLEVTFRGPSTPTVTQVVE